MFAVIYVAQAAVLVGNPADRRRFSISSNPRAHSPVNILECQKIALETAECEKHSTRPLR
jgi:hypothetical protein